MTDLNEISVMASASVTLKRNHAGTDGTYGFVKSRGGNPLLQSRLQWTVMQQDLTFFIAGIMQGSRPGTDRVDQSYRPALRKIVSSAFPNAKIHCPLAILERRFAATQAQALTAYEQETAAASLNSDEYSPLVSEIRTAFVELVRLAGTADVVVAYLPSQEASMGTAMEMWNAYHNNKIVITISPMTRNLAIVATSTIILPSIEYFEAYLASGQLEGLLRKDLRQEDVTV